MTTLSRFPSEFSHLWALDPGAVYLNHGSFGACTKFVLTKQQEYRDRMEAQPVRFMMRQFESLCITAREKVSAFVNSDTDDLVFVQNATAGVGTVFRSLRFNPGDEILITNHTYAACRKLLEYIEEATGAVVVEAKFDIPISSPSVITEALLSKASPRTKIALIDHITSATSLVLPVREIVKELDKMGIDTMVDGAHAPGNIPVDIKSIGAAYYTANCHKWLCSPKSSAILLVRKDKQEGICPLIISHAGHKSEQFAERFYWQGTLDPSPLLCVPDSIAYMSSLMPGGWDAIMKRNHDLCIQARNLLCREFNLLPSCPDEMNACMSTIEIPAQGDVIPHDYKGSDVLQDMIYNEFNIEIPIWYWSDPPRRVARISAQLYNTIEQFEYLVAALHKFLL